MSTRLFHVSEEPGIEVFSPRPSPQHYDAITGEVIFAISDSLLHNYLLPRNCPRVTYYAGTNTSEGDKKKFLSGSARYVIAVEAAWREAIRDTVLYCYEFASDNFELLDANAGYYISYNAITPVNVTVIENPLTALADRGVEVVFVSSLWPLAEEVQRSTLCYSLIRMSHAERKGKII